MRIYVKGFGCSSSVADAEVLAGCLSSAGHTIVNDLQNADMVLYNTCAVKTPTENRIIYLMKRIPKEKKLIVAGCLPLINFERLCKEVRFDGVVGPAFGEKIVDVVTQVSRGTYIAKLKATRVKLPQLGLPRMRVNPRISIIPINYGCLGSCTYCCVRFARGKLRSYCIKEIVNKVEKDLTEGVREFWLTSQDTACYGKDIGTNLAELLDGICNVNGDFFVRVGMMTPNNLRDIADELVEAFRNEKVFKFLHLPVQSGDDDILRRMNRFYLKEDFITVIKKFKKLFPQSTIATDVIVGFPGETEKAFKHTWDIIEEVRPDIVNISKFFARPKTLAKTLKPQIPHSKVKQRSARLAGLARYIAFEQNSNWSSWSGRILVDEIGKAESFVGRNFAYKPIVIRNNHGENLLGRFICVKIVDVFQSHLLGETLQSAC